MSTNLNSYVKTLEKNPKRGCKILPPLVRKKDGRTSILGFPTFETSPKIMQTLKNETDQIVWRHVFGTLQSFAGQHKAWSRFLAPHNHLVHGPFLRNVFAISNLAEPKHAVETIQLLLQNYLRSIAFFLNCLESDWNGPSNVRKLELLNSDPHRGGQFVACVDLKNGERFVFKSRPISLEALLFGADTSLPSVAWKTNEILKEEELPYRLPLIETRQGSGQFGQHYGYINWVNSESLLKKISVKGHPIKVVQIKKQVAESFWADAGFLSAFCVAVCMVDLHQDNLIVGYGEDKIARYTPIDCEIIQPKRISLEAALLTRAFVKQGGQEHYHAGIESEVLLCGNETHKWGFVEMGPRWSLELIHSVIPTTLASLVTNSKGQIGYGPYVGSFLEGLLAGWDFMIRHRQELASLYHSKLKTLPVRYLVRSTRVYARELERRYLNIKTRNKPRFSVEEKEQMAQFDIPYFFRVGGGGPLYYYQSYPDKIAKAIHTKYNKDQKRSLAPLRKERIGAEQFPAMLHDAIDHVFDMVKPIDMSYRGISLHRTGRGAAANFEGQTKYHLWKVHLDRKRAKADFNRVRLR